MNADTLVVAGRRESQANGRLPAEDVNWQEVAAIEVEAVHRERVDLIRRVPAPDDALPVTPV
jgi:hypothetical protein